MNLYQKGLADEAENRIYEIPEYQHGDFLLDEHQTDAMVALNEGLLTGDRAFSIVHSCGSGKSVLEANMLLASLKVKEQLNLVNDVPDIILTTERALIHSLEEEFKNFGIDIGIWGAGKKILDRPAVLTTIQALQKNKNNLSKILPLDRVPLILGDEADLYLTKLRKDIVTKFNKAIRIGFTATDSWPDGRNISELWGKKIHQMPLKEGIKDGVNVPPMFQLFEANIDEEDLEIKQGDYDKKSLSRALKEAEIQKAIPDIYRMMIPKDKRKEFPTLVYVPSVFLVHDIVENFKEQFDGEVSVKGWTGDSVSSQQIQKEMKEFNNGEIDVLVLCEMGGRGINLPRARALIDGYPTLSPNKLEQRHGRPLRKIREGSSHEKEGFEKPFSVVAQIIPKANSFRPYMLPDLLDCWDDFREGNLLGARERGTGGNPDPIEGYPIQAEVKKLRDHINEQQPTTDIQLVKDFSILEQLQLRDNLPKADENGVFEKEGKKYGSIPVWAKEFNLNEANVGVKLKNHSSILGKNLRGQIISFYSEDVVRHALGELIIKECPLKEGENITTIDGERIASTDEWAKIFQVGKSTIRRRIPKETPTKYRGRTGGALFTESFVREKIKDLIVSESRIVDKNGFCEKDGIKYGTVFALTNKLGVTGPALEPRIKNISTIKGKDRSGHIRDLYPEDLVIEACKDLLEKVFVADEDGIFIHEGERYGSVKSWERILDIGATSITRRLKKQKQTPSKQGRIYGRVYDFYPESFIREICSDLLQNE